LILGCDAILFSSNLQKSLGIVLLPPYLKGIDNLQFQLLTASYSNTLPFNWNNRRKKSTLVP